MNNSSQLPLDPAFATPLQRSLNATPFASAKSLAPFSPHQETLCHARSARRMSSPLQIDPRLFELPKEGEAAGKEKPRTLARQTGVQEGEGRFLQGLLSPSHLAKIGPRISFTYRAPALQNARSQLTTGTALLHRALSSRTDLQWPLARRKGERCRLSSNEFSFAFVPPRSRKIEDYSCTLTSSIRAIPCQEQGARVDDRKPGCESKVASTTASSGFPLRSSDFGLPVSHPRQNSSEIGHPGSSRNLLDSIPSKQLGRTVMLPSHYSFGGLIQQSMLREGPGELMARQWRNHFQLGGGDMKESIHCGPELRSEHKFQMLGGYGREIKESTTSFCE